MHKQMSYGMTGHLSASITFFVGILLLGLLASWAVRAAYAGIPDSGGVIHACYDPGNGALRVIDSEAGEMCRPKEMALSWNRTGPQGPEGPEGPRGARGPSDGYVSSLRGGPGIEVDQMVNVLSLSLPAGDYMLSGSARVQRGQDGTSSVVCDFRVGGGPFATGYAERVDGVNDVATIAATGGVSVSSGEMVHLTCFAIGDSGSRVTHADLTAIRVETVTRQ